MFDGQKEIRNIQLLVNVCRSYSPVPFLLCLCTVAAIVGAVFGLFVAIFCILLYLRKFKSFRNCQRVDCCFFLLYLKWTCCFSFALLPHCLPLWIASTTNMILKLRNGQLPSLHDPLFGTYRNSPDNVVSNIGNVLESVKFGLARLLYDCDLMDCFISFAICLSQETW